MSTLCFFFPWHKGLSIIWLFLIWCTCLTVALTFIGYVWYKSTIHSDMFVRMWCRPCAVSHLSHADIRPVGSNSIASPVLASKLLSFSGFLLLAVVYVFCIWQAAFVALYAGQWVSWLHVGAVPTPPLMKDQGKAMVTMEILTRNKPWVETSHRFTSLPKKNPGVSQHSWDENMCCLLSIFITQ